MEIAFELPFSRHPAKPARNARPVVYGLCGYPFADISSFRVAASGEIACHSPEGVF
ncbi:hypothetical protein [Rhizobium sp. R635]|uniref:hypothetical protein n=1 Tax=Rhizobium sp. R635 TaxID=1764275 RepID=UPI00167F012C|nr:hypothetical protein [Rhizobium sp. R635]